MNANRQYRFILSFVILALFTAGISPACKFISGAQDGFIEICTSVGIKKVPVPSNGVPPVDNRHKAAAECLFCFSAQVDKVVAEAVLKPLFIPYEIDKGVIAREDLLMVRSFSLAFDARAPPYFS